MQKRSNTKNLIIMKKFTSIIGIMLTVNLLSAQWIQQNPYYPNASVLNDIFFIDQYNGWTVDGVDGNHLHTENSGLDWNWFPLGAYMDCGESVFFTDANHGWVCGGQHIWHTTDGGLGIESWLPQNIDISPGQDLISIFFIDSLNGWAYGTPPYLQGAGDLFKTTDGGDYWEKQISHMNLLLDMYFLNESAGYSAGIYFEYTTDGGDTWNSTDINMVASSLDVIDENNIWIAGYDDNEKGIIKSSVDGGLTWNKKLGDTIQFLNDITFIDSNNGWAVGDSGTILHTSDGGNNWEFQESGTIADLNSVYFVDENYGWICGDSSIILHTDNGGTVGLIESLSNTSKLEVYPNPSNSQVTITFKIEQKGSIILSILNSSGQEVKQISSGIKDSGKIELDCSKFSSGIYLINLQTEKGILTEKLIIE